MLSIQLLLVFFDLSLLNPSLIFLRLLCFELLLFRFLLFYSGIIPGLLYERLQLTVRPLLTFRRPFRLFSLGNRQDLWFTRQSWFGRQVLWHRSLLSELVPELLSLPFGNIVPASFDLCFSQLLSNFRLRRGDRSQLLWWCNDIELVPLYGGFEAGVELLLGRVIYLVIWDLLTRPLLHELRDPLVLRSIVINYAIVVCNICYICRSVDQNQVLLWWHPKLPV